MWGNIVCLDALFPARWHADGQERFGYLMEIIFLYILLFVSLLFALLGALSVVIHYSAEGVTREKQKLIMSEEDGWQEDSVPPHIRLWMKIRSRMIGYGILGVCLSIILLNNEYAKIRNQLLANQYCSRKATSIILRECNDAQIQLGRFPNLKELSTNIDPPLYASIFIQGGSPSNPAGYSNYVFKYLETSDGIKPDPSIRAFVAIPVVYGSLGKNIYYRTTESSAVFQADANSVTVPNVIIPRAQLSTTWKPRE
jgi:hypothetical protein